MLNQPHIRPAIQSLRRMPTLQEVAESVGKLELKLETEDTRYWITTRGVTRKTNGLPINYVVDYVTVEKLSSDGNWDLKAVYSPTAWKLSQGFDYCQMLHHELARLQEELETEFSWEKQAEVERLERELILVNNSLRLLSEQVRAQEGD